MTNNCPACGRPNLSGAESCAGCGARLASGAGANAGMPITDADIPVHGGRPWITYGLLVVNVAVWLVMVFTGGSQNPENLLRFGAKYGPLIYEGEYWRLLAPMFLHIGFMHLLFNSYALLVLGMETEAFFGRARFLILYLMAGVLSVVLSYVRSSSLSAGASGAIFGLVGALVVYYCRRRKYLGGLSDFRLVNLAGIVVVNFLFGFLDPKVDNAGHLGGLLAGVALGWLLAPDYRVTQAAPAGSPRPVDRVTIQSRWWVLPAVLVAVAGLTMLGNVRESRSAYGLQQRGEAAMQQGDWRTALDAFSRAIDQDSGYWPARLGRAETYLQLGDQPAALRDYQTVIDAAEVVPQYRAVALTGRGRANMLQGNAEQALQDLETAVTLAPTDPFARFVRGLIYYETGRPALAREDLQASLEMGLSDEQSLAVARNVLAMLDQRGE